MDLITIIVPVYNVGNLLNVCMESIVNQTWTNLEIILVDDGSNDSSNIVCDEWAEKDKRVKVIHKSNGGPSSARNEALKYVTGKYIMFVDSDDIVDTMICEELIKLIKKTKSDIVCSQPSHGFRGKLPKFTRGCEYEILDREEAIVRLWYQRLYPSPCGKLYRSEIFNTIRFTVGRRFEDIDIMHEIFWSALKIVETKNCMYGYMHREGSITTGRFSLADFDIILVADKILDFAKGKSLRIQRAAMSYAAVAAIRVFINAPDEKEFEEGRKKATEILKLYGKDSMKDSMARRKNRIGLMLYFYACPLIKPCYKLINRWK